MFRLRCRLQHSIHKLLCPLCASEVLGVHSRFLFASDSLQFLLNLTDIHSCKLEAFKDAVDLGSILCTNHNIGQIVLGQGLYG